MTIKINTRKSTIPVEIDNHLKYEIDMSDENLLRAREVFTKFHEDAQQLTDDDFDGAKKLIIKALDELLGKGAGEAIYEHVGGAFACADVINQLGEGIIAKANQRGLQSQQTKATKYVESKKQRQQRQQHRRRKK